MGITKKYTKSDDTFLLFVDEKDSFHPLKWSEKSVYPELFVLLGIGIQQSDFDKLVKSFNEFKKKVRPNLNPMDWELKGAKGFKNDSGDWCSKEEMKVIWIKFAEFLSKLDVPYTIHGVFSDKRAVVHERTYDPPINWKKEGLYSFMRLNFAQLLINTLMVKQADTSTLNIDSEKLEADITLRSLKVYFDEMKDLCINADEELAQIGAELDIQMDFNQLGFEKNNTYSVGIQFVDILLYIIYKFMAGQDVVNLSDNADEKIKYYNSIMHSIRQHFRKNILLPKKSAIFMPSKTYNIILKSISKIIIYVFCNSYTRTNHWCRMLFDKK
ncbi:hypothetical protein [Aquibacillus saliphilus]|uniref:hypothetical protein n=1 Tax=Aquibacillus saliphilus TaxID=1909422 RepID=UPI001CF04397|nr:hypothetical protein [Aquibacillus saliphilus]